MPLRNRQRALAGQGMVAQLVQVRVTDFAHDPLAAVHAGHLWRHRYLVADGIQFGRTRAGQGSAALGKLVVQI